MGDSLKGCNSEGSTNKARIRQQKSWERHQQRIENRIRDIHDRLSAWLCRNYCIVVIPVIDTQRKASRSTTMWNHDRFRKRLIEKAESYPECQVIECDDTYTAETCGVCSHLNRDLGSSRTFRCSQLSCDYVADRNSNAARNILIRFFVLHNVPAPVHT